jgi:peptidoglycan-associated lipoprotein
LLSDPGDDVLRPRNHWADQLRENKEDDMGKAPEIVVIGIFAVMVLLVQACATKFGSADGDDLMADEERIDEPTITHILPPEFGGQPSRIRPSLRAELSAINATGLPKGFLMDILFDFDQSTLRTDALPVLEANAQRLQEDGITRLLLEGRGDEVGTAAYNLVLGERRAKAVKGYLEELGLEVRVKTTSYGKDRPLCLQHSEACMQKNRSVHFVVKE